MKIKLKEVPDDLSKFFVRRNTSCGVCFICHLIQIFREVKRVLRPDGVCWVNLGDSYHGSWGNYGNRTGKQRDQNVERFGRRGWDGRESERPAASHKINGIKPKDLYGIPWMFAFAMRDDGWWLRADCVWAKINTLPESVRDRPVKSHEYCFLFAKSERYFYDNIAVLEPYTKPMERWGGDTKKTTDNLKEGSPYKNAHRKRTLRPNPAGRARRSVFSLPVKGYKGTHCATYPESIPEIFIKSGTSENGCCSGCGSPYERIIERVPDESAEADESGEKPVIVVTKGWKPACECKNLTGDIPPVVPCVVLDPFGGAGTTALVAGRLGRDSVSIELSHSYCKDMHDRIEEESGLWASIDVQMEKAR